MCVSRLRLVVGSYITKRKKKKGKMEAEEEEPNHNVSILCNLAVLYDAIWYFGGKFGKALVCLIVFLGVLSVVNVFSYIKCIFSVRPMILTYFTYVVV